MFHFSYKAASVSLNVYIYLPISNCKRKASKESTYKRTQSYQHILWNQYRSINLIWQLNVVERRRSVGDGGDVCGVCGVHKNAALRLSLPLNQHKSLVNLSLITRCYCMGKHSQTIYLSRVNWLYMHLNACTTVFMDCYHSVYLVNMKAKINSRCQSVMQ